MMKITAVFVLLFGMFIFSQLNLIAANVVNFCQKISDVTPQMSVQYCERVSFDDGQRFYVTEGMMVIVPVAGE